MAYKEKLPKKSKHQHYHHILWITPPSHANFYNNQARALFARALEQGIKQYPEIACLSLKKVWNPKDNNFFLKHQSHFLPEDLSAYWLSVDAAVKFWDRTLLEILLKWQKHEFFKHTSFRKDNRLENASNN